MFGHVDDGDVADEKTRIQDTPVETLQQTDSIILKVYQDFSLECEQKNNFLISQPIHMLWVLKRTVSMRRFF